MNVDTDNAERRPRKTPPRRVPTLIEQRERKSFIFGWGADLNHREREQLKERIALFGGIALAVVLAAILGWGAIQDTIIRPQQIAAENRKPVASIGDYTITMGFFKRFERFEKKEIQSQLSQYQQELSTLQAKPKKNAALITQLETAIQSANTQLTSLAQNSLTLLLNDQTILQGSRSAGIPITHKVIATAMKKQAKAMGSKARMAGFIKVSGLTKPEFQDLVVANYVGQKLQTKLAAEVPHYQTKVHASHILIPSNKKALAVKVYHLALGGKIFAVLAKKYSIDATAKKGGDLGWFTRGTMVPAFNKAVFSMKVGQIRLVKSRYGWHIIKLTGRKRAHLSKTEYQQAQASALSNWLTKEQSELNVQRFVAPANLPGASSGAPQLPASSIPPSNSSPPSSSSSSSSSSNQSTTSKGSTKGSTSSKGKKH